MRPLSRFPIVLLVAAALALAPAGAESTPEARQWLEKLASVYDRGPFSVNYSAEMQMAQMGQVMDMTMNGSLVQDGRTRFRMNLDMQMSVANPEGGAPGGMNMSMLGVSDGTVMWMETDNPMMGGKAVIKLPLDKLDELSKSNPMIRGVSTLDPVAQIEELTRMFDFDVLEENGGTVKLRAEMTEETVQQLGSMLPSGGDASQMKQMTLVFDKSTGFPTEIAMGGEQPLMTMRFTDLQWLGSVDATTFAYTPPEGANVMDLGAMAAAPPAGQQP